jgi:hypothetical protein
VRPARWLAREEGDIYIDERMRAQRAIVGVLLLAAVVLAGCGDNRSATAKAMEVKFEQIDYQMSILETATSSYNRPHFEKATEQYIALVRQYADQLGPAEAKRRLSEKGDELGSYCLPCTATLRDEASRY